MDISDEKVKVKRYDTEKLSRFSKKGDPNFDGKKLAFQHFHVGVVLCLNKKGCYENSHQGTKAPRYTKGLL